MRYDPDTALARYEQREADRRRERERQRDMMLDAGRVMIPDEGVAVPLARIATHAGLSRAAGHALFIATTDLATELVCRAWRTLAEQLDQAADATPEDVLLRLVQAIRADATAHRIRMALSCGTLQSQRHALAAADKALAVAVAEALRRVMPGWQLDDAMGRRVLTLARVAVLDPEAADARSAAATILTMVCGAAAHAAAAPPRPSDRARRPRGKRASAVQYLRLVADNTAPQGTLPGEA